MWDKLQYIFPFASIKSDGFLSMFGPRSHVNSQDCLTANSLDVDLNWMLVRKRRAVWISPWTRTIWHPILLGRKEQLNSVLPRRVNFYSGQGRATEQIHEKRWIYEPECNFTRVQAEQKTKILYLKMLK